MRRSAAEWLLVPLFLLPLGVGLGLVLVARGTYLSELDRIRRDGETEVRGRIDRAPGGASSWPRLLLDERPDPQVPDAHEIWLQRDRNAGRPFRCVVRLGERWTARESERVWRIGGARPIGLGPQALADPETRLRIETTETVASLEGVDEATRVLAELLERELRDVNRLRESALALSTKLYVIRRWCRGDRLGSELLGATERVLEIGMKVLRWFDALDAAPGPGVHRFESVTVRVNRGILTTVFETSPAFGPPVISRAADSDDPFVVECVLVEPRPAGGEVLWRGRLETPIAGTWRVVAVHGRDWWRTATFRRWSGPVAGALLAYLLIPTALLISIRRRRRLDEARRRFITELAHDLRTPLTSVRLYAEMLEAGRVADGDRDEYVSVLARESGRLTSLLANLLDLSRLDRGQRRFEPGLVDVEAVVEAAVRDVVALEPGRAGDVKAGGPEGCLAVADPEALARALANLLENAGKFTPAGTRIAVGWREDGDEVAITVEDDGPGIPSAEWPVLFERFARGGRAARDGIPGTGLGLSLVRELIEGSGGRVRHVDSSRGAVFEIRLRKVEHA